MEFQNVAISGINGNGVAALTALLIRKCMKMYEIGRYSEVTVLTR